MYRLIKTCFGWLLLAAAMVGVVVWNQAGSAPTLVPPVAAPFTLDAHIAALALQLGIPQNLLIQAHATYGRPAQGCGDGTEDSCFLLFTDHGEVYLYPSSTTPALALAHEYLHWVWYDELTQAERDTRCTGLIQAYQTNLNLYERMSVYRDRGISSGDVLCSELHSIVGTEMAITELTPSWQAYYYHWLPGLNSLPSSF